VIPLSEIEWGPIDANTDGDLLDKWIEPSGIRKCLSTKCWIISGEKGSGKSAISRVLDQKYGKDFHAVRSVDFDDITFKAIYENISKLALDTHISRTITLTKYWQYAIIVEIISACYKIDPNKYGSLWHKIPKQIRKSKNPNETIFTLAQNALKSFRRFLNDESDLDMVIGGKTEISAYRFNFLATFPIDEDFKIIVGDLYKKLKENNHVAMLIFDGFDTLKNDLSDPRAIKTVFASLILAIQNIRTRPPQSQNIIIKAFIPHDQFISISLKDSDKISEIHAEIRWDRPSLREFVKKRITNSVSFNAKAFEKVWRHIMPSTVFNSKYGHAEDTFDYIIRHTMMRPRQVQIHLRELSLATEGRNVDPSDIPKSIRLSCEKQAGFFVDEYKLAFPILEPLVREMKGCDNVMTLAVFENVVKGSLRKLIDDFKNSELDISDKEISENVNSLYNIGFFGILELCDSSEMDADIYYPPLKGTKRHRVDFFFKKPVDDVKSRMKSDSLVAIHPMFFEYANLKPHSKYIVG
jgi:hypothetical protein